MEILGSPESESNVEGSDPAPRESKTLNSSKKHSEPARSGDDVEEDAEMSRGRGRRRRRGTGVTDVTEPLTKTMMLT